MLALDVLISTVRVLIIGCGYVGLPLGTELVQLGHEVFGVTRSGANSADLQKSGIHPLAADITQRAELDRIPLPFDWVVTAVSSNKGGADDYRQTYLEGLRHVLQRLEATPPKKFVHVSCC
jgi:nucleoside-diphosphate-sugar epimerase